MTNSEQYWNAVGEALEAQMLPDAVKHPAADDGCDKLTETVERARREIEDSLAKSRVRGDPSFLILLTGEEADALLAALTPAGEVGPEHWSREQIKREIVRAMVEYSQKAPMAQTAGRAADAILHILGPALSRPNVDEGVTQADRDAAARWAKSNSRHQQAANIKRGSCDTAPLVQAFRAHRVAALNGSGNHG